MDHDRIMKTADDLVVLIFDKAERDAVPGPEMMLATIGALCAVIAGGSKTLDGRIAALEFAKHQIDLRLKEARS